jgi:lipopolysaccharide export LptBFGC system permease protein LptF
MPDGVIVGGWSYVIAAYSITAVGLIAYAWSLVHRRRKAELE